MNFQQFRISYRSFLLILNLCIFLALILWIKNTYYYVQDSKLLDLITNGGQIEKNLSQIWEIAKEWLINTGWLILKIIIICCISCITKRFPVFSKWLVYWDSHGEFSPVLGREIAKDLRYNTSISFERLMFLYSHSQHQIALLKMHGSKPHLQDFLKKYDPNYENDLKIKEKMIIKNYFLED